MKLPFVILPRGVYEQMLKAFDDERVRSNRLTRTVVKMKVAGGSIPRSPLAAGASVTPRGRERDRLMEIIDNNKHARARPAVHRALVSYLDVARSNHVPEEDIERVLMSWNARKPDDAKADEVDDDTIAVVDDEPQERATH